MSSPLVILALDSGSAWIRGLTIASVIVLAYLLTLWVAMVAWTYRDASGRTVSPMMRWGSAALVAIANIPGILLYLAIRPREPLVESFNRQLEAEAFLREVSRDATCTSCRRTIEADYAYCPYCTAQLQSPCTACDRLLRATWTLCPYCATPRTSQPASRPAAAAVAATSRGPIAAGAMQPWPSAPRITPLTEVQPLTGPAGASGG
jgi:RNA polymerase subunit RPABC4/transcription elongation factor Spt4